MDGDGASVREGTQEGPGTAREIREDEYERRTTPIARGLVEEAHKWGGQKTGASLGPACARSDRPSGKDHRRGYHLRPPARAVRSPAVGAGGSLLHHDQMQDEIVQEDGVLFVVARQDVLPPWNRPDGAASVERRDSGNGAEQIVVGKLAKWLEEIQDTNPGRKSSRD